MILMIAEFIRVLLNLFLVDEKMNETILTFDYALFQQQFPVYANPMFYPESLIQSYWDIAINYISNVGNFGSLQGSARQYAINLFVAHLIFFGWNNFFRQWKFSSSWINAERNN